MEKYYINNELVSEERFEDELNFAITNYVLGNLDDLIDESYYELEIKIAGITFEPSRILRELDHIAYLQIGDEFTKDFLEDAIYYLNRGNEKIIDNKIFKIENEEE